jgi:TolB-like protein/class 3 adenylate cyclase/tetratricopeptide (TPR) repeat protein
VSIARHRLTIVLYKHIFRSPGCVLSREHVERRLTAVLAADVAGYSRLMGRDEEGTLAKLKSSRRALVDPAIAEHRGHIVKTTGDGVLAEFASAVDAARCAIEVQRGMAEQNIGVPQELRIEFRIGIHVGDIIIDENDIFGDGVNIAARLEGIAQPGGVCISDDTHRQIRGKVDIFFDDMGPQVLKNIAEPMRVWRMQIGNASASTSPRDVFAGSSQLALPDKPSIAVLPFQNMSGDPEQEYFADGMVEDIIAALSRFRSLFVIARNSSFTYKGKAVDIKKVGRELGVRYVLEGSVQKAGGKIRIIGQLIEAATDRHLWADKFDGSLEDVFDLQDQVTTSVVGLIAPTVERAEIERANQKPTDKLDSYDLYLRGMATFRKASLPKALALFRAAIEGDPEFAAAYAMAAGTLMRQQNDSGVPLVDEMRTDALQLARLGVELANEDAFTLARCGHVLAYLGHEYDRGASLVEQAVALNPNLAIAWFSRGWVSLMCAEYEHSIESFDRMIRLSPLDPMRIRAWAGTSFALFHLGRYEEGSAAAKKSIQYNADAHTLSAYILNTLRAGRASEAGDAVKLLLQLQPGFRASHVQEVFPIRLPEERNRLTAVLREAGLPD